MANPESGDSLRVSQTADVSGLRPALALGDFELNPLIFLEIPET